MRQKFKAWLRRWLGLERDIETLRRENVVGRGTIRLEFSKTIGGHPDRDEMERRLASVQESAAAALQTFRESLVQLTDVEQARLWLGLDGPGGLANVLSVRDAEQKMITARLDAQEKLFRQAIPVLNQNSRQLERLSVYEQQVPSIKRIYNAMQERAMRAQRKKEAERALAAEPVGLPPRAPAFPDTLPAPDTAPMPGHPPQDAVLDDVSAEVGGG